MSIMELGALGEFVGSILVLGTLVYLAVQVRQGIAHSRFTTNLAIMGAGYSLWLEISKNPDLAMLMTKLETGEPLVDAEPAQAYAFANMLVIFYLNAQNAIQGGLIGAEHLSGWQADLTRVLIKYPSIRAELLELVEGTHNPDYPIWEPLRDETA
jgi:hypothetical protein